MWLQLDENQHSTVNNAGYDNSNGMPKQLNEQDISRMKGKMDKEYGDNILKVTDANGKALNYTINKTMMRIDLPTPLKPGQKFVFNLDWSYKITNRMTVGGRGGYETLEDGIKWMNNLCDKISFVLPTCFQQPISLIGRSGSVRQPLISWKSARPG